MRRVSATLWLLPVVILSAITGGGVWLLIDDVPTAAVLGFISLYPWALIVGNARGLVLAVLPRPPPPSLDMPELGAEACVDAIRRLGLVYDDKTFVEKASDLEMLKLFLGAGMDPDTTATWGSGSFVDSQGSGYSIRGRTYPGTKSALMVAAEKCEHATALLLRQGADPNGEATEGGWSSVSYQGSKKHEPRGGPPPSRTALGCALAKGRHSSAKLLIEAGASVTATHETSTPLEVAAENASVETIELLLQKGADPNVVVGRMSPIARAAARGRFDSFLALLSHTREPSPALFAAAEGGSHKIVDALLQAGVEVNQKDGEGMTPLMLAAIRGHRKIVFNLLERGADPNALDADGANALAFAMKGNHTSITKLLRSKMR